MFDFDSFLLCYHSEEKCRRLQDHQISLGSKKWFLVAGAKAEQEIAPLAYILKGLPPIEMSLKRYQSWMERFQSRHHHPSPLPPKSLYRGSMVVYMDTTGLHMIFAIFRDINQSKSPQSKPGRGWFYMQAADMMSWCHPISPCCSPLVEIVWSVESCLLLWLLSNIWNSWTCHIWPFEMISLDHLTQWLTVLTSGLWSLSNCFPAECISTWVFAEQWDT